MNKPQTRPEDDSNGKSTGKPLSEQPKDGESCLTPTAVDDRLDEELDQSFPASDPPSFVRDPPDVCNKDKKNDKSAG